MYGRMARMGAQESQHHLYQQTAQRKRLAPSFEMPVCKMLAKQAHLQALRADPGEVECVAENGDKHSQGRGREGAVTHHSI